MALIKKNTSPFSNATQIYQPEETYTNGLRVTIFDESPSAHEHVLGQYNSSEIPFGRNPGPNGVSVWAQAASRNHGKFVYSKGSWYIVDNDQSTYGLQYGGLPIQKAKRLQSGDVIRIDSSLTPTSHGALLLVSSDEAVTKWQRIPLAERIRIGRSPECEVHLDHLSASLYHAQILYKNGTWYLIDNHSANGTLLNGQPVFKPMPLQERDIITITNSQLVFTTKGIYYSTAHNGISLQCVQVKIKRGHGKNCFENRNPVNMDVRPGEMIALVGGSGAGKSTLLNCLCGYLKPSEGKIFINGIDLYSNLDTIKNLIGYVPQSDIIYDKLSVEDMLNYSAKMRLSPDTSKAERNAAVDRALNTVQMQEFRKRRIDKLSGGQKKRVSIAVELLSDPNLLFLDEPTSGLDPYTEKELIRVLRQMADQGKTIILVTHSTLQLAKFDKVAFMGYGGNHCYFGSLSNALKRFGVNDVVDIYDIIQDKKKLFPYYVPSTYGFSNAGSQEIEARFRAHHVIQKQRFHQLKVLAMRYMKLISNDRFRLLFLILQAPFLAALLSLVANGSQFEEVGVTKSLLFSLTCCAVWIGLLDAIQEVCKERSILKREFMTGLSLSSYVLSKFTVLGLLGLVQSVLMVLTFDVCVGLPSEDLLWSTQLTFFLTTFLTTLASSALGIFVSCFFNNSDRAMVAAPILLMPQILFSGMIFSLSGITDVISMFIISRWGMEAYGTISNLNDLPSQFMMDYPQFKITREIENAFEFSSSHLIIVWMILLFFVLAMVFSSRLVLSRIASESA